MVASFQSHAYWKPMTGPPIDLLQGTVDVLILRTLAWEPMHGYGVSRCIRQRTEGVLTIESAALYQALHRLERKKWIRAEWGLSENNRRAKYYALTTEGRKRLRSEAATWRTYGEAVFKVLEPV
jgi:transcriptional regulator